MKGAAAAAAAAARTARKPLCFKLDVQYRRRRAVFR